MGIYKPQRVKMYIECQWRGYMYIMVSQIHLGGAPELSNWAFMDQNNLAIAGHDESMANGDEPPSMWLPCILGQLILLIYAQMNFTVQQQTVKQKHLRSKLRSKEFK